MPPTFMPTMASLNAGMTCGPPTYGGQSVTRWQGKCDLWPNHLGAAGGKVWPGSRESLTWRQAKCPSSEGKV